MQDPSTLKRKVFKNIVKFEDGVTYTMADIAELNKLSGPNKKKMLQVVHALKKHFDGKVTVTRY